MLRFRPHHFLCTVGFSGKGYSDEFVSHYLDIARQLRETPGGDGTWIEVVPYTDSICEPCPNRRDLKCTTEEKVQKLDSNHAAILGIKAGEKLTWGEAKKRISEKVTVETHHQMCAPCGWRSYGICEKALVELKKVLPVLLLAFLTKSTLSFAEEPVVLSSLLQTRTTMTAGGKQQNQKILKNLALIQKKLSDHKWNEVETLATTLVQNSDWGDYALFSLVQSKLKKAQNLTQKGLLLQAAKEAQKGLPLALQLRNRFPSSPLTKRIVEAIGLFEWMLADAHPDTKKYDHALQWLDGVSGGFFVLTPDRLDRFARTCFKSSQEQCESWVRKLLTVFPKSSLESKTLTEAFAKRPLDSGKLPTYSRTTQAYREPDPDQKAADLAVTLALEGKESDAKSAFKKFLEDYPRSAHRFRVRYWLAEYDGVFQENVIGNYGLLSSLKIQKSPQEWVMQQAPKEELRGLPRTAGLSPSELVRLSRAEQLMSAGAFEFASRELEEVRAGATDTSEYLLYLLSLQQRVSNHWAAFGVLSELIQRSESAVFSDSIFRVIFPLEGWDLIQKVAKENELDPILLISQIKQESGFYSRAVSSKGATGWMQLMPFTAIEVDPTLKIADLADSEINLRLGAKYLKKLIDRFGGNMAYALAGYNAGPNAADRWIKAKKPEWGPVEFTESIPYRETREYVWSIIRNYYWYTALQFKDQKFPGLEYFFQMKTRTP